MADVKKIWILLKQRFDYKFYPDLYWYFAILILAVPFQMFLPVECGYETGFVENTQLAVLAVGIIFCLRSKYQRGLFYVAAAILLVMMLRETNFGKTIFYPDPVRPNRFLSWDKIWYAPYVDPVMIGYGVLVGIYAIRKKLWNPLWKYICKASIPVWMVTAFILAAVGSSVLDKCKMDILEEMVEMAAYAAMVGILRIYAYCIPEPQTEEKDGCVLNND